MLERKLSVFGVVPITRGALVQLLAGYSRPNDKLSEWLNREVLIPLKRGMYLVGPNWRSETVCLPLIANRLYGPSCVSLEYALSWHGMIPERVAEVTSVCTRRGRLMTNPLGTFSYTTVPRELFSVGLVIDSDSINHFWIASREKAICDKVLVTRNLKAVGRASMLDFLFEDQRVDPDSLADFDFTVLDAYEKSGLKPRQFRALRQAIEDCV